MKRVKSEIKGLLSKMDTLETEISQKLNCNRVALLENQVKEYLTLEISKYNQLKDEMELKNMTINKLNNKILSIEQEYQQHKENIDLENEQREEQERKDRQQFEQIQDNFEAQKTDIQLLNTKIQESNIKIGEIENANERLKNTIVSQNDEISRLETMRKEYLEEKNENKDKNKQQGQEILHLQSQIEKLKKQSIHKLTLFFLFVFVVLLSFFCVRVCTD